MLRKYDDGNPRIFCHWNTVWWKSAKFTLTKNISSNQLFSDFVMLVKTLFSRNFCQKSVRVNFCKFHSVCEWFSYNLTIKMGKFCDQFPFLGKNMTWLIGKSTTWTNTSSSKHNGYPFWNVVLDTQRNKKRLLVMEWEFG